MLSLEVAILICRGLEFTFPKALAMIIIRDTDAVKIVISFEETNVLLEYHQDQYLKHKL